MQVELNNVFLYMFMLSFYKFYILWIKKDFLARKYFFHIVPIIKSVHGTQQIPGDRIQIALALKHCFIVLIYMYMYL